MSEQSQPDFTVEVFQNEYLPAGSSEVDAVITVTSSGTAGWTQPMDTQAAEVIIIDCSASMRVPPTKIARAREATSAAIDAIRDGVAFAIVSGTHGAEHVYPLGGGMATASTKTRQDAKRLVDGLQPHGGTAIGQWLRLAYSLFTSQPATLRHAILLTDGKNEHETPAELDAAIRLCDGVFTCDCRGVGTSWEVKELRRISTALLGTVDIVPDPADLAADFTKMMKNAMGKELADLSLRVWTPQNATVQQVKQVAPTVDDLTGRQVQVRPQLNDYPTGAWGAESRDYHIRVRVAHAAVGQEMLAARVSLVHDSPSGPQVLCQGLVKAIWTDDEALSTRINSHVAHFTGQAELADAIQEGLEARKVGDERTATVKLGRAVALAHKSGNEETAKLLAKVVDVVDPATGTVRLKAKVADADEMALDTRSTKTVRVKK